MGLNPSPNVSRRETGVFGGNLLVMGQGPDPVGFHEECQPGILDGSSSPAQASDNNFFGVTADAAVLVRRAEISITQQCSLTDLTSLSVVNTQALSNPYRAYSGSGCNSENIASNPLFVDGFPSDPHIADNSPLRQAADSIFGCANRGLAPLWPRQTTMVDFDNTPRPAGGSRCDIGADEVD